MNVIRASALGYCAGVRRAVDIALREAAAPQKVYTAGPLIHNPVALETLKMRGIEILEEDADAPRAAQGAVVVIRAHGVTPRTDSRLRDRGFRIADASCPKVKRSQTLARKLSEAGVRVFLAGEKRHAEIVGIQGYASGGIVVESAHDALEGARILFAEYPAAETAVIAQTTLAAEDYAAICGALQMVFPRITIYNTICSATRERQNALRALCEKVDAIIIAGGRNSANTQRLVAVARAACSMSGEATGGAAGAGKPVVLVENAREMPEAFLRGAYAAVGLSAGASTPDEVIDEIERTLLSSGDAG
ncbi:MAG: 4-hydroxy-3-methylbut-2-enyl diphosphate reductase [Treponema sp.]|nr:4-hydroxy-3-methylbut-2-enyl diphosphate reductase [Treponema sp.]